MAQKVYKMTEGSLHEAFFHSRNKIQVFAGGFANGKTSASCVLKALPIARDYPGANILLARSTYPKLNDTLRKEFLKWCPKHWLKGGTYNKTDNYAEMTNGTVVNFRYIAQQGKSAESSTSNLLSANYDLVIVDQIEDPEISEKDFYDLLGRLRGNAQYIGSDPTMPRSGPRWMVLTSNPTRNWFYKKVVKPVHQFREHGQRTANLIVDPKTAQPLVDVFEGSTYINAENLEEDYISTLEATYKGQMRSRFLMGEWGAYEGLVYPMFDEQTHVFPHDQLVDYYNHLLEIGLQPTILEGYDHGLAVPSCYLWGFVDHHGNVFVVDGYYAAETTIAQHTRLITDVRALYQSDRCHPIIADPALFRRTTSGDNRVVGRTVAAMFAEDSAYPITMTAGNNDVINGIHKVQQYLSIQPSHFHPFNTITLDNGVVIPAIGAPHLYVSDKLEFMVGEFTDYYWKKDTGGEATDVPTDKNDHAMDTIKYMLSRRPPLAVKIKKRTDEVPAWMTWSEMDRTQSKRSHRYG